MSVLPVCRLCFGIATPASLAGCTCPRRPAASPTRVGEWRRDRVGRFAARYTFFTTNPPANVGSLASGGGWRPAGSGVLAEAITLGADGKSYDSAMTLRLFDASGKPVTGGGEAVVHAIRAGF